MISKSNSNTINNSFCTINPNHFWYRKTISLSYHLSSHLSSSMHSKSIRRFSRWGRNNMIRFLRPSRVIKNSCWFLYMGIRLHHLIWNLWVTISNTNIPALFACYRQSMRVGLSRKSSNRLIDLPLRSKIVLTQCNLRNSSSILSAILWVASSLVPALNIYNLIKTDWIVTFQYAHLIWVISIILQLWSLLLCGFWTKLRKIPVWSS